MVFLGVGSFEPTANHDIELLGLAIPYDAYPVVYAIKIVLTMAAMAVVWPGYRQFPCRISPLAVAVGLVGAVVYVGFCKLELEGMILPHVGLGSLVDYGARSGFNPWSHWPQAPHWAEGYLALRFWGLVVVVPIIEEFFLRGLVMRYFIAPDWWKVPFGTLTPKGRGRRHAGAGDHAPADRSLGRCCLVYADHLANVQDPQHLGLRAGPWGDELVARFLRPGQRGLVFFVVPRRGSFRFPPA